MQALMQHEVLRDASRISVELPLGERLEALAGGVGYPLVRDPRGSDRACIVGMTVLRPRERAWAPRAGALATGAALGEAEQWCDNVPGADGGATIAAGDPLDVLRLALQYALADAVIVGSGTVLAEGMGPDGHRWQPEDPAATPQLRRLWPALVDELARVRRSWQEMGVLSSRPRPLPVMVSRSGTPELLQARVLQEPQGAGLSAAILTSRDGARRLRGAGADPRRIELIDLSPAGADGASMDLAVVPALLRDRLDVRIAEHDGGRTVMAKFAAAGALDQLHLTLMRDRSLRTVLDALPSEDRPRSPDPAASASVFFPGDGRLPPALEPISLLAGTGEALVACLDARGWNGA